MKLSQYPCTHPPHHTRPLNPLQNFIEEYTTCAGFGRTTRQCWILGTTQCFEAEQCIISPARHGRYDERRTMRSMDSNLGSYRRNHDNDGWEESDTTGRRVTL